MISKIGVCTQCGKGIYLKTADNKVSVMHIGFVKYCNPAIVWLEYLSQSREHPCELRTFEDFKKDS